MKKEKILTKAIEKIYKKGFKINHMNMWKDIEILHIFKNGYFDYMTDGNKEFGHINEILFDPSFCKALFGEEDVCSHCGHNVLGIGEDDDIYCRKCLNVTAVSISWKYHGKSMFLTTDRLEYIKQFI